MCACVLVMQFLSHQIGRSIRKKCDEMLPVCSRCRSSERACVWPTSSQMVDLRYAAHPRSRHNANTTTATLQCLSASRVAAHSQHCRDVESVLSEHFFDRYHRFLLLPKRYRDFNDSWMKDIRKLMVNNKSLQYSLLANAASHMYNRDGIPSMMSVALTYYSLSMKSLSITLVAATDSNLASSDACLMAIIFLYLHGVSKSLIYI